MVETYEHNWCTMNCLWVEACMIGSYWDEHITFNTKQNMNDDTHMNMQNI
jgi:hypothetical protein